MSFEREWFIYSIGKDRGKSVSTNDGKYPDITIFPVFTENGDLAWSCTIVCRNKNAEYTRVEITKENINLKDLQKLLIWTYSEEK